MIPSVVHGECLGESHLQLFGKNIFTAVLKILEKCQWLSFLLKYSRKLKTKTKKKLRINCQTECPHSFIYKINIRVQAILWPSHTETLIC